MSGTEITITVHDEEVQRLLKELLRKMGNLRPVMAEIGEIVVESVQRNFEKHQSWEEEDWDTLSPEYERWKTKIMGRSADDILILNRVLMGSIHYEAEADRVRVGTDVPYAAVHQFGASFSILSTRRTVHIPARPYLGVRTDDWREIKRVVERYLLQGV